VCSETDKDKSDSSADAGSTAEAGQGLTAEEAAKAEEEEEAAKAEQKHKEAIEDEEFDNDDDYERLRSLRGIGSLRTERKVSPVEEVRITQDKLLHYQDRLQQGQYELEDVMRVVCTMYYDGGDKQEEVFVTTREPKDDAIPKAMLLTARNLKIKTDPDELDMLRRTYPKDGPIEVIKRLVTQRGGEVYTDGKKPTFASSKKLYVDEEKIEAKYASNYIAGRRFFSVGEIKEQLVELTKVKLVDQIVTYRDHILEADWSMEMIISGDRVASLAMYENPKVVSILKAAHQRHAQEMSLLQRDIRRSIENAGSTEDAAWARLKGEVQCAVFEDKVEEAAFYDELNRENQVQLVRLQALWQEHKWEGSTGFIERKDSLLTGINTLMQRLLLENQALLKWVELEEVEGKERAEETVEIGEHEIVGRIEKEDQGRALALAAGGAEDRDGTKFAAARKKLLDAEEKEKVEFHHIQKGKRENIREIILYMAFLCVVSVMMFGHRDTFNGTDYYLPDNFRDLIARTPVRGVDSMGQTVVVSFGEVNTQEKLWVWLAEMPALVVSTKWYNNFDKIPLDQGFVNAQNKILGRIRLRQLRMKKRPCGLERVSKDLPECYDGYLSSASSHNPYGSLPPPPPAPEWIKPLSPKTKEPTGFELTPQQQYIQGRQLDHRKSFRHWEALYLDRDKRFEAAERIRYNYWWLWKPAEAMSELSTMTVPGRFGTYSGDGFMKDLSLDDATARTQIKGLKDNKWIDQATSAVIVSINAYNGNLDTYVVVTVIFEMPNTGKVFPLLDVNCKCKSTLQLLPAIRSNEAHM